jgi:hypothetical protein
MLLLNSTPSFLEPGSNFVVGWALIQAILLLYITIVVPFTAVFLSDLDCFPEWSISIDLIIDTYFIVDIFMNAVRQIFTIVSLWYNADCSEPAGITFQDAVGENGKAFDYMRQTILEAAVSVRCNSFHSCCLVASWIVWPNFL